MICNKEMLFHHCYFNFFVAYAIRRVQGNHDGSKLNGRHQLFVYAGDLIILGGSVHTIKKNRIFL